jgi:hypothetical protein
MKHFGCCARLRLEFPVGQHTTSPPGLDFAYVFLLSQAPNRAAPATTSAMTFTSSRPT